MDKIKNLIKKEAKRQREHFELIASENYVSKDVMKATGSILTNKYAEGYPNKRYYGGCEYVDKIEQLAIDRLKKLFHVKYANVQPYSGSVANAAAIAACIKPGDKIMGLALDSGGHLTHGYKISFSGVYYQSIPYYVNEDGLLDYEEIKKQAIKEKPDLIICGYSAYSRIVDFKKFREIADACGAKLLADIAHISGLIIGGMHPSPVGLADIITSTTHKTLRGPRGAIIMTNDDELTKKIDRWVFPGYQGGPLMHVIAAKAIAFKEASKNSFKKYAIDIINNTRNFAQSFLDKGIKIVSDGTDNHLFTINVYDSYNGLTGKEAEELLAKFNITVNKNTVPFDKQPPMISSGIRLGTAAMTSRGFDKWYELGNIIHDILSKNTENDKKNYQILKKWTKKYKIKKHY